MHGLIACGHFDPFGGVSAPRGGPARGLVGLLVFLVLVLGSSSTPRAHEVPADVLVRVLVKPEGNRLRVLVRVPTASMLDIVFPQRGPGYLNISEADPALRQAAQVWVASELDVYENDVRLEGRQLVAVMASLPSDRSFASYDEALAHVLGPRLPDSTEIVWQQTMLDMLFEYPIQSDRSQFSIDPTLARLGFRTQTVLRFVLPDGTERAFDYRGNPGLVRLDPRWSQAALRFVVLGFEHILDGADHLLFLACLVIPFRRLRPLVAIVTSFTIAHSVTLIASAFGFAPDAAWFPPLVETLIALSIVYMAIENMLGVTPKRRWMMTFAFGLVHGFGFSFALRETLQFAGRPPADVASGLQRRRRDRPAAGDRGARGHVVGPVPVHLRRAGRNPAPLGPGGAHGVALDERARKHADALQPPADAAGVRHAARRRRDALGHAGADRGDAGLADVDGVPEARARSDAEPARVRE